MAQSAEAYFTQLCKEAGIPDADVAPLIALAKHEKLGPKFNELVKVGTEDYQAALGRLGAAQKDVEAVKTWHGTASKEYEQMQAGYLAALAEVGRLQKGGTPNAAEFMTKKDFETQVQQMAGRYAGAIKTTASITARHVAKFGEEPDFDAIDKIAMDRNVPLDVAYKEYIQPRVQKQEEEAKEKWKKDTREEMERDLRTNLHLPAHEPSETSTIFSQRRNGKDGPQAPSDEELARTWVAAGQSK